MTSCTIIIPHPWHPWLSENDVLVKKQGYSTRRGNDYIVKYGLGYTVKLV